MSDVMCQRCKQPTTYRARETIADVLHGAALHCATQPTDWTRRFTDLVARLAWVEGELRGVCNTCVLEQVTQIYPLTPEEIEAGRIGRGLRLVRP